MSNSQEELFEMILSGEYNFPKPYWNHVSNAAKVNLINEFNFLTLIFSLLQFFWFFAGFNSRNVAT